MEIILTSVHIYTQKKKHKTVYTPEYYFQIQDAIQYKILVLGTKRRFIFSTQHINGVMMMI